MSLSPLEWSDSLAQHRVWGLLTASARQDLLAQSEVLDLHAGDLLAQAGQWSAHLWLILQGRVDLDDPELARTHTLLPLAPSAACVVEPAHMDAECRNSRLRNVLPTPPVPARGTPGGGGRGSRYVNA